MDARMIPALLFKDAHLLVRQYSSFARRGLDGLSLDQRRAWAAEMAEVMAKLVDLMEPVAKQQAVCSSIDITVEWNRQMSAGERISTHKLTLADTAYLPKMRE